jgi:hypothetical protein
MHYLLLQHVLLVIDATFQLKNCSFLNETIKGSNPSISSLNNISEAFLSKVSKVQ